MIGRVGGKVAFITGAARGQGRSHAVRLAQEGADIIALDICAQVGGAARFYPPATEADLAQTVREVEALDRRIVARQADVRDFAAVDEALRAGMAELGHVDIVAANAGIFQFGSPAHEESATDWDENIAVNLTGVWNTVRAAVPLMIAQGTGGSIVLTQFHRGAKGHAQPGRTHPGRFRADHGRAERLAGGLHRAGRREQRPVVPRLRRGPVHHRRRLAGGRRRSGQVGEERSLAQPRAISSSAGSTYRISCS